MLGSDVCTPMQTQTSERTEPVESTGLDKCWLQAVFLTTATDSI